VAVQREVFVKVIVAPETSAEEIATACLTIRNVDPSIPLILQPVTRNGKAAVPANLLLKFQEQAARLLGDVRVIPQTHVFLDLL
jgi:organic radical activating enzyme